MKYKRDLSLIFPAQIDKHDEQFNFVIVRHPRDTDTITTT